MTISLFTVVIFRDGEWRRTDMYGDSIEDCEKNLYILPPEVTDFAIVPISIEYHIERADVRKREIAMTATP